MKKLALWLFALGVGVVTAAENPLSSCFEACGLHSSLGGKDKTHFTCRMTEEAFLFRFEVWDDQICVAEQFESERVVEHSDRVEVFFSPTPELQAPYYCAEIDSRGRIMDYRARLYRSFDFSWNFRTMRTTYELVPGGYVVSGSVTVKELKELGIDPRAFGLGVFRGDYDLRKKNVAWCSAAEMPDFTKPDFHKPDVFFWFRSGTAAK